MVLTREEARVLLKQVRVYTKRKVKTAGGRCWTKIADSGGSVTLVIKVTCIDSKNQTTITEFAKE